MLYFLSGEQILLSYYFRIITFRQLILGLKELPFHVISPCKNNKILIFQYFLLQNYYFLYYSKNNLKRTTRENPNGYQFISLDIGLFIGVFCRSVNLLFT